MGGGAVLKKGFIALPAKGGQGRLVPSKPCPALAGAVRSRTVIKEQSMISWWTFFRPVGGEVTGGQDHQPDSSWSSVSCLWAAFS